MDKVPNGIEPMLKDLEEHIVSAGLADMVAAAETITTVSSHFSCLPIDFLEEKYQDCSTKLNLHDCP